MTTQQISQQKNAKIIEELFNICNEAIAAALNGTLSPELLRTLEGHLMFLKTERWDGESLTALEVVRARKMTLDGILALQRGDAETAAKYHRSSETTYGLYRVTPSDWRRIQNNYHWLAALAASGDSFDARYKRYEKLEGLRFIERLHAWALTYIGKPYYRLTCSPFRR